MKIAIYIRVSTEDRAKEGYSLEMQREYLGSFAKREGYQFFKIYSDVGYDLSAGEKTIQILRIGENQKEASLERFEGTDVPM